MIEHRPCKHESVQQSDRDGEGIAGIYMREHATALQSVQQESIAEPGMDGRNDERLTVDLEAHVADQCFIENAEDGLAIVGTTCWVAFDGITFVLGKVRHQSSS